MAKREEADIAKVAWSILSVKIGVMVAMSISDANTQKVTFGLLLGCTGANAVKLENECIRFLKTEEF